MAKGKMLKDLQARRKEPEGKWEKGTVLGPERGLGEGLAPRDKVDVPLEVPEDMESAELRRQYLWGVYGTPGPVVLITTVDLQGNVNCAPMAWSTCAGSHAFLFVCNTDHDTYGNVQATGEFVVNVPGAELADRLQDLARKDTPAWANELARAGLTEVASRKVRPPRVAECRAHLECHAELVYETSSVRELGTPKEGTDVLVLGKIEHVSADAEVLQAPTYAERIRRIRPMVLGPGWLHQVVDSPRELPGAWDLEF